MSPAPLADPLRHLVRSAVLWRHGIVPQLQRRGLAAFERLPAEEQRRRSFAALRHVFFRAYHGTAYYKRRFDERGLSPRDLRSPADLARFPLLAKADVFAHHGELVSAGRDAVGAGWDASGGSTGEPLRFLRSRLQSSIGFANEERTWRWYGAHPGARQAYVWGDDRDAPRGRVRPGLKNRLVGTRQLNAFNLDEERCALFADVLEAFQPEVVYGYATALALFAGALRDAGRKLAIRPRAIRSTAEVLLPEHRALVEARLGGPVYDHYGSRETGPVASECARHDGLHVFHDVTWVEVLRPDGSACEPGETGEVVATKLHEHAMPFLRYRTGDRAAWLPGECACGLAFPRLSAIQGRVGDFVRAPGGRAIHGEYFTHLFYGAKGVTRFQVRQPTPDTLRILVQAPGETDPDELERIRRASAEQFGATAPGAVTLEVVDFIEPGRSGKHRFVLPHEG